MKRAQRHSIVEISIIKLNNNFIHFKTVKYHPNDSDQSQ